MAGITSLSAHILYRFSRIQFDITPVAGTRKARKRLRVLFAFWRALVLE